MANRIVLNPVSYHGAGAVKEIGGELSRRGYKRAFIACGRHVVKSGEINKITDVLDEIGSLPGLRRGLHHRCRRRFRHGHLQGHRHHRQ